MIFGFVALLIAGLAYFFYARGNSMLAPATAASADLVPNSSGVASGDTIYGPLATVVNGVATGPANMTTGTEVFTEAGYKRFVAGASSYDPNDPATAKRIRDNANQLTASAALPDAIARATAANALQSHLMQLPGGGWTPANGAVSNVDPGTSTNIGDNTSIVKPTLRWDGTKWIDISNNLAPQVGPKQIP